MRPPYCAVYVCIALAFVGLAPAYSSCGGSDGRAPDPEQGFCYAGERAEKLHDVQPRRCGISPAARDVVQMRPDRGFLIGIYADPPDHNTTSMMHVPWDYTINNSYQDDCPGCGVSGLAQLSGKPVIVDIHHVQSSYPDFESAATGAYDSYYDMTTKSLEPYATQILAVRIDSEFNGFWSPASAFRGPHPIDPAIWIAGFRKLAAFVRISLPTSRIIWNPNIGQHNPFRYYPGDDVVDALGPDLYCQPQYFRTSAQCWKEFSHHAGGSNLDAFVAFARRHGKALVIPEWADLFGDGYVIRQMAAWMDRNNVVAQSYWDSGDGLAETAALSVHPCNRDAYLAAFGHRPYRGKFWSFSVAPAAQ